MVAGRDLVRQRRVLGDRELRGPAAVHRTTSATRSCPARSTAPVNAPEDIDGGVSCPPGATSAAYDNVTVTANDTGATLFSDQLRGRPAVVAADRLLAANGRRYVQSSTSVNDARSIINGAYNKDWTNYTLELDATKLSGAEGFLSASARRPPNDYYWWNLGGWNNTRSALQRANGGSANEVKALEGTGITTGQTYQVKVVVDGTNIKLYLDGELQMSYDQPQASEKVFQVVTRDKKTGDLVAKVVNTSTSPVRTDVNVSDVEVAPTATVTTLAGAPVGGQHQGRQEPRQAGHPPGLGHLGLVHLRVPGVLGDVPADEDDRQRGPGRRRPHGQRHRGERLVRRPGDGPRDRHR